MLCQGQGTIPVHRWPLPRSGRSAGLSLQSCRSTAQFVDGMSQSHKVNSCTLPGKNTPSYTLKSMLSHSQTLFPTWNPISPLSFTVRAKIEPLSSWICSSQQLTPTIPAQGRRPFMSCNLAPAPQREMSSAGSGLCKPTLPRDCQHCCGGSCSGQDRSSLGVVWQLAFGAGLEVMKL